MVPSIPVFRNDVGNNLYIICELEKESAQFVLTL